MSTSSDAIHAAANRLVNARVDPVAVRDALEILGVGRDTVRELGYAICKLTDAQNIADESDRSQDRQDRQDRRNLPGLI